MKNMLTMMKLNTYLNVIIVLGLILQPAFTLPMGVGSEELPLLTASQRSYASHTAALTHSPQPPHQIVTQILEYMCHMDKGDSKTLNYFARRMALPEDDQLKIIKSFITKISTFKDDKKFEAINRFFKTRKCTNALLSTYFDNLRAFTRCLLQETPATSPTMQEIITGLIPPKSRRIICAADAILNNESVFPKAYLTIAPELKALSKSYYELLKNRMEIYYEPHWEHCPNRPLCNCTGHTISAAFTTSFIAFGIYLLTQIDYSNVEVVVFVYAVLLPCIGAYSCWTLLNCRCLSNCKYHCTSAEDFETSQVLVEYLNGLVKGTSNVKV